jgi:hypothetical protein
MKNLPDRSLAAFEARDAGEEEAVAEDESA